MGGHHNRHERRQTRGPRPTPRSVTINLEPAEFAFVTRTINGTGGHQGLLLILIGKLRGDGRLELTADEIEKVRRYAQDYGPGGYQDRFKAILAALERAEESRGNR